MLGRGGQPVELKLQEAEAFVEGGVELDMIGYAGLPPRHRHAAPAVPQSTCGSAEVAACGSPSVESHKIENPFSFDGPFFFFF